MRDMTFLAAIVTGSKALTEFQLLLHTLEQWVPAAEVFVFTDTPTYKLISSLKSRIRFQTRVTLDEYAGLTRKDMEARDGRRYATLFHDYTMEKAAAMQWVFEERSAAATQGVWFLDADICLLAPLPTVPTGTSLGLSPHYIRVADEARYGHYNAGMIWVRDSKLLDVWKRMAHGSRFYEQAALEEVAKVAEAEAEGAVYEFPIQDNFGWWRYLQSADAPPVIQERLGYNRRLPCCGLTYEGAVLRSIHTHWDEVSEFNEWMRSRLEFLARSHPPAKQLVQLLQRLFWNKKEKKE
jgi:hypothetical protein